MSIISKKIEIDEKSIEACLKAARILAVLTMLIGAAGLAGWIGDIQVLARPSPWLSPMSTITALLLCFSAIALALLSFSVGGARAGIAFFLGALIVVIGASSLVGHSWGVLLPFDRWFLDRSLAAALPNGLNRMSPVSSLCFMLFGAAVCLAALPGQRGSAAAQGVSAGGILVALISLIGYLYSIASLVAVKDFKPIAPQTAIALFISFVGIFLASPQRGAMQTLRSREIGGILARRLLVFVLALPVFLGGIASAGLKVGILSGPASIFFLTAATDLSLAGLLLFNAFTINRAEVGRRAAQLSLEESERAYRALFESAADPMFLVDDCLLVLEANVAAAECLEMPTAGLRGHSMPDLAPACAGELRDELARAFQNGEASFEACGRTPGGRDVPLEIKARAVEVRGTAAVLIIARDLTERRRAERVLAEKDGLLRQAQKMEAIGRLRPSIMICGFIISVHETWGLSRLQNYRNRIVYDIPRLVRIV